MQLANKATANLALAHIVLYRKTSNSASPSSKYGHFFFEETKMATGKIQTWGFKTAVHQPMGDIMNAMFIIQSMILTLFLIENFFITKYNLISFQSRIPAEMQVMFPTMNIVWAKKIIINYLNVCQSW